MLMDMSVVMSFITGRIPSCLSGILLNSGCIHGKGKSLLKSPQRLTMDHAGLLHGSMMNLFSTLIIGDNHSG